MLYRRRVQVLVCPFPTKRAESHMTATEKLAQVTLAALLVSEILFFPFHYFNKNEFEIKVIRIE